MPLARLTLLIVLALSLASAGCIENMGDLKEALGVQEPQEPAPVYLAPLAKATASVVTALVGEPVGFSAEGSKDAQGLALAYLWTFGDGQIARELRATHTYAFPGTYQVRLDVSNAAGLADQDTLTVTIRAPDLAPTAAIRVLDAAGAPAARGTMGAPLTFEAIASDPEGAPLAFAWDFGAAGVGSGESTTRAFAAPGQHEVRLTVTDRAGQTAVATLRVPVDGAWRASGAFEPAGASEATHAIVVPAGAQALDLQLTFSAGAMNDVEIVVLDAAGAEVARSAGEPKPGAQGEATRVLALDAAALGPAAPGAWSVKVVRELGLAADWTLVATLTA